MPVFVNNHWTALEAYGANEVLQAFAVRSPSQHLYLACRRGKDSDAWLFVPVSVQRMLAVRDGKMTLREAVERCAEGWVWRVVMRPEEGTSYATPVAVTDLANSDKPFLTSQVDVTRRVTFSSIAGGNTQQGARLGNP